MNPSTDPPRDQGGDADARPQNPPDADHEADPGNTIDDATSGASGAPPGAETLPPGDQTPGPETEPAAPASPTAGGPAGPGATRPPSAHVTDQAVGRIPAELRALPRWVVWRWVWRPDKDKGRGGWDKPPIDPRTGRPTDATDDAAWMSFEEARALARNLGDGIGFALGKDGPYCGVDLDKVIDDRGEVAGWAQATVNRLASYTEVTPSGAGLRVWVRGKLPRDGKGKSKHRTAKHPGIEFYDSDRYFTVSGSHYPGTPTTIEDRAAELAELHAEIFAPKDEGRPGSQRADLFGLGDDDTLIAMARAARNGPKFAALFDQGDTSGYGGDDSAADFALCAILGFWTGDDPARVERIFDRSALGQRDKWKDRADYRATTIRNALDGVREFYKAPAMPAMKPAGPQTRPSAQPSSNGHTTATAAPVPATGGAGSRGGGGGASGGGGGGALPPNTGPGPAPGSRRDRLQPTPGVLEAPDDPHRLARAYVMECYAHPDHPKLVYHGTDFHEHVDGHYRMMPDDAPATELTDAIKREFDRLYFLDYQAFERAMVAYQIAMRRGGHGVKPKPPEARKVRSTVYNDTMRALKSIVAVPHASLMPCWLTLIPDAPDPRSILPTRNALVDLSSAVIGPDGKVDLHRIKTTPSTPAFFSPVALDYSFDPDAPEPTRWLQFLEEVFPNDLESRRELQKWFGYLISMDTRQQKMLYLIGLPRSGKGTVLRVLTHLVGPVNVMSPALTELAGDFGLSDALGKTVMTITDARVGGDDKDLARLQERLLKISGEDWSQINRKNKPIFTTKLLIRIVIASNAVPEFRDPNGAFRDRMRPIRFCVSFVGKEDLNLFEKKLIPEMNGILNWAIVGRAMLHADGMFLVPKSARGLVRDLVEATAPLQIFLNDCCTTTDPRSTATKKDLFVVYQWWCKETANKVRPMQTFGKELQATCPQLKETQLKVKVMDPTTGKETEKRSWAWRGIRIPGSVQIQANLWIQARDEQRRTGQRRP